MSRSLGKFIVRNAEKEIDPEVKDRIDKGTLNNKDISYLKKVFNQISKNKFTEWVELKGSSNEWMSDSESISEEPLHIESAQPLHIERSSESFLRNFNKIGTNFSIVKFSRAAIPIIEFYFNSVEERDKAEAKLKELDIHIGKLQTETTSDKISITLLPRQTMKLVGIPEINDFSDLSEFEKIMVEIQQNQSNEGAESAKATEVKPDEQPSKGAIEEPSYPKRITKITDDFFHDITDIGQNFSIVDRNNEPQVRFHFTTEAERKEAIAKLLDKKILEGEPEDWQITPLEDVNFPLHLTITQTMSLVGLARGHNFDLSEHYITMMHKIRDRFSST